MRCEKKIDDTGRITIPKYMRKMIGINGEEKLDVTLIDEVGQIVLRRKASKCAVCGSPKNLTEISGAHICRNCIAAVSALEKEL